MQLNYQPPFTYCVISNGEIGNLKKTDYLELKKFNVDFASQENRVLRLIFSFICPPYSEPNTQTSQGSAFDIPPPSCIEEQSGSGIYTIQTEIDSDYLKKFNSEIALQRLGVYHVAMMVHILYKKRIVTQEREMRVFGVVYFVKKPGYKIRHIQYRTIFSRSAKRPVCLSQLPEVTEIDRNLLIQSVISYFSIGIKWENCRLQDVYKVGQNYFFMNFQHMRFRSPVITESDQKTAEAIAFQLIEDYRDQTTKRNQNRFRKDKSQTTGQRRYAVGEASIIEAMNTSE